MQERRDAGHKECTTGRMQGMRNARQERCRACGMHDRIGAGMRNVRQEGCRTRGIYDRKGAGHEEYTTGGCRILGI